MAKNDEMAKLDLIFCGNPGTGKSTLLSSISNMRFESGISFGEGLTSKLEFKESPHLPGVRFGDTPGLADIAMAERAARAITKALQDGAMQGRITMIFFVVTAEEGRVRPNDLFTIKQVMGSIELPDGKNIAENNYGVIINKCTFMADPDFINGGKRRIETVFGVKNKCVPYATTYIKFLPRVPSLVDGNNCMVKFDGLVEWIFDLLGIEIAKVTKIDVSHLGERLAKLEKVHAEAMKELERKLAGNQEEIDELQKSMDASRRDMQRQIDEAKKRNKKGGLKKRLLGLLTKVVVGVGVVALF